MTILMDWGRQGRSTSLQALNDQAGRAQFACDQQRLIDSLCQLERSPSEQRLTGHRRWSGNGMKVKLFVCFEEKYAPREECPCVPRLSIINWRSVGRRCNRKVRVPLFLPCNASFINRSGDVQITNAGKDVALITTRKNAAINNKTLHITYDNHVPQFPFFDPLRHLIAT